jgi:5,10-methylenetetrahydromethanopterin reductase
MGKQIKTSVMNVAHYPPARLIRLAQLQEERGYDMFWYTDERFYREVFGGLTLVATNTQRIELGTLVTDPYIRHPAVTAMGMATLDEVSGGRAALGVGAGITGFEEMGIERRKPVQALREMVTLIRRLLAGETVDFHGEVFDFDRGRLGFRPTRASLPVYIASNGPLGLALAGEVADGVVMQGAVTDGVIDWMLEQVSAGAARAGRDLTDVDIVARVNVCISTNVDAATALMRRELARTVLMQQPGFVTFKAAGLDVPASLREAAARIGRTYSAGPGVLDSLAAMVPHEFVEALTLAGTVEHIAARVSGMVRRGISHITIAPFPLNERVEDVIIGFAEEVMPRVRQHAVSGGTGRGSAW